MAEQVDLPPGFAVETDPDDPRTQELREELARAEQGEHIVDADNQKWVVLIDHSDKSRRLVHEDVTVYDEADHPAITGAAAFFTMILAMFTPLVAVVYSGFTPPSAAWALIGYGGAIAGGFLIGRVLLNRTPVGTQLFRFLEWWEHKELIEGRDLSC